MREELSEMPSHISLKRHEEDSWLWLCDSSGVYLVHSTYLAISVMKEGSQACPMFSSIWKAQVSQKVQVLIWRTLQNRLASRNNLTLGGVMLKSNFCPFYVS